MEFSPDTPTAGYERYVSESESTDGEGDVSGGQQRMPRKLTAHETPQEGKHGKHAGHQHAVASSLHQGKGPFSTSSSSSGSAPSIFSRIAASWKKGSNSAAAGSGNGSTATLNGITNHHGNSRHRVDAPAIIGGAGGGTLWREMQEGSPRSNGCGDGTGQGFDGGSSSTAVAAGVGGVRDALAAGITSVGKSSSGLKGLKASLLTEDGDAVLPTTAAAASTSFGKDGQQTGREGADGSGGGAGEGLGRGLWDEAAAGDVSALAAALSEGGGGDVHACNTDGWTALHSAAHAGQGSAVMCLLVGRGASPAAVTRRGFTPLHTACMRGRLDAARALLCLGADANARASDQRTPLHFACEAGSPECVKELLRASASPNVSDQDGRTPLHFACIDGSTECVRRLLSAGASHFPPDAWGRDPAAVARQLHRAGPLQLLEAAAAAAATGGGSGNRSTSSSSSSSRKKQRSRGGSSSMPPAVAAESGTAGRGGGDASGGDAVGGEETGQSEENEVTGAAAAVVASAVVGKRWVVMNEGGRMLERRTGKVALFKSMAAAVDWANGVTLDREITSGSFQVTEVAPSMRRAFEREVAFEMTGGGTLSEEEEEEKQDPQWTRYRRQRAAARKAAGGGVSGSSGAGERHRRGAWTAAAQRRDEDEARALLTAAGNKLREVSEEADMHRQKAASLERALEAVLRECDDLAAAVRAENGTVAVAVAAEKEEAGADLVSFGEVAAAEAGPEARDEEGLAGSDEEEVEGEERGLNRSESAAESAAAAAAAAAAPSLLLGVDAGTSAAAAAAAAAASAAPSLLLGVDDAPDSAADAAAAAPSLLPGIDDHARDDGAAPAAEEEEEDALSDVSESESDGEEEEERQEADDVDDEDSVEEDRQARPASADADADAAAAPSLLVGVDDPSDQTGGAGAEGSLIDFASDGVDETRPSRAAASAAATASAAADTGGAVDEDADADISDGSDDGGEAAALERLAAWLSGLKIRKPDAARYAASLVADGFDSGEALRGVREEELLQYDMKKGHARLVVTSLKAGIEL